MDNKEQKLIRLLLTKDFYQENKHLVLREMFPKSLAGIYDTIVQAHQKYERNLNISEIRTLHLTLNPTLTRAERNNIGELLFDIESDDSPLGPDLAKDVLSAMWRVEVYRQIAEIGVDGMAGKETTLQPLTKLIESHADDFLPVEDVVEVNNDLDSILEYLEDRNCWRFNIPSLAKRVPGGAGGDMAIIFARPEHGKTASHVSLACGPDGFCSQGAQVYSLINEEPGERTIIRAVMAHTGMTLDQVKENRAAARVAWQQIRDNYHLIDNVDMSIERLDSYCKRHKPDVLIVDQLDKIHVQGSFGRPDQRLRAIYTQAREIAKRHKLFLIAISQASADAEGKTKLTYAMMEESKTGKAAEADLIIGIGSRAVDDGSAQSEEDPVRFLTVSKNKITGWHGTVPVVLDKFTSRYHD